MTLLAFTEASHRPNLPRLKKNVHTIPKAISVWIVYSQIIEHTQYGKDFMSVEFPPSYSNFPMYCWINALGELDGKLCRS